MLASPENQHSIGTQSSISCFSSERRLQASRNRLGSYSRQCFALELPHLITAIPLLQVKTSAAWHRQCALYDWLVVSNDNFLPDKSNLSHCSEAMLFEARPATDSKSPAQAEQASEDLTGEDPGMNGNYPDPSKTSALPIKRQFRDPHADWWDKQERRNYGEPVHEDNDILGIFSPEQYTWVSPGKGALQLVSNLILRKTVTDIKKLMFVAAFGGLVYGVSFVYPDRPSAPRTFPGGLEAELGGPGALRAHNDFKQTKLAKYRLDTKSIEAWVNAAHRYRHFQLLAALLELSSKIVLTYLQSNIVWPYDCQRLSMNTFATSSPAHERCEHSIVVLVMILSYLLFLLLPQHLPSTCPSPFWKPLRRHLIACWSSQWSLRWHSAGQIDDYC
ncbi:hypothetical protein MRB53_039765 [Persea americana]|nr:hypothetical protein MRB53_039765 [Persea americana]